MTDSTNLPTPANGFANLGLAPELLQALVTLGYEEPTPIQREAIPRLLEGRDLLGQAGTGTGKTAAFALPMLSTLPTEPAAPSRPRALVLVPTRELAMQVAEAVHRYGKGRDARVLPIYGGQSFGMQLRALGRGVDVVVATPGRALDHLDRGTMFLDAVKMVVLDEADEMLDMGFADDLEAILQRVPGERQTALFSATMHPRILAIAEQHLKDPARVTIARERTQAGAVPRVKQVVYVVARAQKHAALGRVLDMEQPGSTIVFCRTRLEVDELTEAMNARGYRAEALHGGFAQDQRDRVMKRFRSNQADLLVATDVAARGLDIDHVSHVVNYDVPTDPDTYVHRIGRTGRAGREGVAITFAEPREQRLLRYIEKVTQQKIAPATLPTVADLRHRRLELTKVSLREALVAGDFDEFRSMAAELANEHDPLDVAAAALKMAHEADNSEADAQADEMDVELQPTQRRDRPAGRDRGGFRPGEGRPFAPRERFDARREPRHAGPPREGGAEFENTGPREGGGRFEPRSPRGPHGGRPADDFRAPRGRDDTRGPRGGFGDGRGRETTRLFVGAGRIDGLRPGDLVGAIANEAGLPGGAIGAIEITDRFSLVEVPADAAESIVVALRGTTIRGRRVLVRRDRESAR